MRIFGPLQMNSSKKRKDISKSDIKKYMPKLYEEMYGGDTGVDDINSEIRKIEREIKEEIYGDLK